MEYHVNARELLGPCTQEIAGLNRSTPSFLKNFSENSLNSIDCT